MQTYIGVKCIKAEPMQKDGVYGYKVVCPDGYESWSPKDAFEKAYFPIAQEDRLSKEDIDDFFRISEIFYYQGDSKTTVVRVEYPTGFVDWDTASCVKPENYNERLGGKIALEHIKDRIWMMLGFVLQWGTYGLNYLEGIEKER